MAGTSLKPPRVDRPLRRDRLYLQVRDRLKEYIPHLKPGTWVQELELCRLLGVSRTPIREAIISLSSEGLLDLMPNGRCHVPVLDRSDVEDLFDIRMALEGIAARRLCNKIRPDELMELETLAITADKTQKLALERKAWDDAEEAFHKRFLQMANNPRLSQVVQQQRILQRCLRLPFLNWRELATTDPGSTNMDLVEALRSGNADRCEERFREHADSRRAWILKSMAASENSE